MPGGELQASSAAVPQARPLTGNRPPHRRQDGDVVRLDELLAQEEPEQLCPRQGGGEQALDGAIAGTVAGPTCDTGPGDQPLMVRRARALRLNWRIVVADSHG